MTAKRFSVFWGSGLERVGELLFTPERPRFSQFSYCDEWLLTRGLAVSPDLPPVSGWQTVRQGLRVSPMPLAFADTEPDAWGRRIISRAYRKGGIRPGLLDASDYLACVDDESRVGALRIAESGRLPSESRFGARRTPTLLDLSKIAASSRLVELESETLEDLKYLQGKGTSLGGARPKCSVLDESGRLCLGKFPAAADTRDVQKGEVLALAIAARAGIHAAEARSFAIEGCTVALIRRFDREAESGGRIPYWSMGTFLGQQDADETVSYLSLVESLLNEGEVSWPLTAAEVLKRLFLNILINNTDDHARNTGVLQNAQGFWRLAPMFDVNPMPLKRPDDPYESKTWLTPETGPVTSVRQIAEAAEDFGLAREEALRALSDVLSAVSQWKLIAATPAVGMTARDIRDYESAFQNSRLKEAKQLLAT